MTDGPSLSFARSPSLRGVFCARGVFCVGISCHHLQVLAGGAMLKNEARLALCLCAR